MSRLYYPPAVRGALAKGQQKSDTKETLEKVAKLIPSEVITGYTSLISLFVGIQDPLRQKIAFGVAFALGIVMTPVYLNKMAEPGKPKRNFLIVSTIAFVVWAYFTSGRQVIPGYYDSIVATASLIIFSLISGAVKMNR